MGNFSSLEIAHALLNMTNLAVSSPRRRATAHVYVPVLSLCVALPKSGMHISDLKQSMSIDMSPEIAIIVLKCL